MLRVSVRRQRGGFSLDAEFEAPTPAVVALFGPSGCGKTTLVNLVAGLLAPDAGRIEVDDELLFDSATGISMQAEKRRVGCVFQDARLFPHLDVMGNLDYGLKRSRAVQGRIRTDEVITLLGLEPFLRRRPRSLSGGERQRVAIGRALLSQPRLLLLDEPLASLDVVRRDEVLPYLERLRDQWRIPMLYVSHQFDEVVRLATHVVAMDAGRVTAAGTLADVALAPGLRRLVGEAAVGAVLDCGIDGVETDSGLRRMPAGDGVLRVVADDLGPGDRVRVQILARDVIIATLPPDGLSVRNALAGHVVSITAEGERSDLVGIDIGGALLVSRITRAATRDLGLAAGKPVWALVKAVSIRGSAL